MKGWIDGVGMINNYLQVFVLQIVYVVKFSNHCTTGTWYFSKVTVSLFKDRPKMGVAFDLNTKTLNKPLLRCVLWFEYCERCQEFYLSLVMNHLCWRFKVVVSDGASFG
jgi:hypothetical protein